MPHDAPDIPPASRLPNYRAARYDGGGFDARLAGLSAADRDRVGRLYAAVRAAADARPAPGGGPSGEFEAAVLRVRSAGFLADARDLGRDAPGPPHPGPLDDVRAGALCVLAGMAALAGREPAGLAACGPLARDLAKIMRSAVADLDPDGRRRDEEVRYHGVGEVVRAWDGAAVTAGGRAARVEVACGYRGGVSASCLENAALDRVLLGHLVAAAGAAADGRVHLSICGPEGGLVRWVVSAAVAGGEAARLAADGGPGLRALYRDRAGLASAGDFVAAAFGLGSAAEAARGYLGGAVAGGRLHAWFHWPAYTPGVA